jgi:hypothetical protein
MKLIRYALKDIPSFAACMVNILAGFALLLA